MIDTAQLIKESMIAKDKIALVAYRSLKAKEGVHLTAKQGNTLTDEIQKSIIKKEIKERKESAEYVDAEYNLSIATLLEKLLPKPLSEREIRVAVGKAIFRVEATSLKRHFGDVMKELKAGGKEMDMKYASKFVRESLN